jgi:hypothetical protein
MRWRAVYDDGSYQESLVPNAYANIDRTRLETFEVYPDEISLEPMYTVDVPSGKRLVYRARHQMSMSGNRALTILIALESEDRMEVDLYMLRALSDGTEVIHQRGYGPDVESSEPPLFDHEIVTYA